MDVALLTVEDLNGDTPTSFADNYYDDIGFGCGEERDGILLLIAMEERDWCISTCGFGLTAFTDAGLAHIEKRIVPLLSRGKYADAFALFLALCEDFTAQAQSGAPYDIGHLPRLPFRWGMNLLIALGVGLIIGLIVALILRGQLKSARFRNTATEYVRAGSLQVSRANEFFLYRTVSRVPRAKSNSSGGSSGHFSASGTFHSGRSGKF